MENNKESSSEVPQENLKQSRDISESKEEIIARLMKMPYKEFLARKAGFEAAIRKGREKFLKEEKENDEQ
ncbi:hypothetical protein [Salinimicrobium sp. WS361]|uniref:hypothetical protein n=1 Tax=Salinimicrobium sp. WS361 TaxID=3425123 RepID=UPI003D6DEDEB